MQCFTEISEDLCKSVILIKMPVNIEKMQNISKALIYSHTLQTSGGMFNE